MGFLATDVTVLSATGPTVLIPTSKEHASKIFQVARTETAAVVKAVLPADASVYNMYVYGSTVSNAATTATVTINIKKDGSTISTGTVDVKTNGATNALVQLSNLPNIQQVPIGGDITVEAVYAETGTASTSGGPWKFVIEYVR